MTLQSLVNEYIKTRSKEIEKKLYDVHGWMPRKGHPDPHIGACICCNISTCKVVRIGNGNYWKCKRCS